MKKYKPVLLELQLKDLKNNAGASDFSMRFQKQRGSANGSETKNTRLMECYLLPEGHVDFVFYSYGTDIYDPDFIFHQADRKNRYKLTLNPSHLYELTIRILNVKDWISTYLDKKEITKKDIKDIFDVSEILIDTNIPSWYWQSGAYNLQQIGGTIVKRKIRAPKFWNKPKYHGDSNFFLDKVSQRIINQIEFYSNQMAQMLTNRAKKKKWL